MAATINNSVHDENKLIFTKIHKDAIIPKKATSGSVGYDFYSPIDFVLPPGERKLIKSGIKTLIPKTHYLQLAPRSGLAFKHGIQVLAGVIDSDFSDEIGIILYNSDKKTDLVIKQGQAICQGILLENKDIIKKEYTVEEYNLEAAKRSFDRLGGFGSTDVKTNTQ
jgi:dUTP pyrophosphatase